MDECCARCRYFECKYPEDLACPHFRFCVRIAELERAKLESPWVYCRDRMPEDEDVVLWRTRSIINPVVCAPINLLGERDEVVKIFGFTHWMPIPELPDQPPPLPETEG